MNQNQPYEEKEPSAEVKRSAEAATNISIWPRTRL
jgi:hypothetical protein